MHPNQLGRVTAVLAAVACLSIACSAHAQPSQKRIDAAQRMYAETMLAFEQGMATVEEVYTWSVRWMNATVDQDPAQRSSSLAAHAERMNVLTDKAAPRVDSGVLPPSSRTACEYYVAEATAWVAEAGGSVG